jgi:hypothetical protein
VSTSEAEVAAAMAAAYAGETAREQSQMGAGEDGGRVFDPADYVPPLYPPLPVTVTGPEGAGPPLGAEGEDINRQ